MVPEDVATALCKLIETRKDDHKAWTYCNSITATVDAAEDGNNCQQSSEGLALGNVNSAVKDIAATGNTAPTGAKSSRGDACAGRFPDGDRIVEVRDAQDIHAYLLFAVKNDRITSELDQLGVKKQEDPENFYPELKKAYNRLQGFWRRWFSIWTLNACEFVKVSTVHPSLIIATDSSSWTV